MADDTTTTDQGIDQSVEDRIANKFGFPGSQQAQGDDGGDASADDGTATGDDPSLAEVDWGGEKFKIPAKLKDAFMQNADYTQKTQTLAERGRQMDHMRDVAEQGMAERAFSQSIATEQQEIAVIDAYLKQTQSIDWTKMNTDQLIRQRMELDGIKERRQALVDSIRDKRSTFDEGIKTKVGELRAKARELASKSITGFTEETEKAVRAYASAEGLSEREIDGILLDPRSFTVLWKASQFDKIKAGTQRATTETTRTLKPGASSERMPAKTAAQLNFNKAMKGAKTSGQKASVIEDRLASSSIFAGARK